jgi:hypothetical protein
MSGVHSRRGFLLAGAALVLTGCATAPTLAAETGGDILTIRVVSKGCAAKADFVFRVERRADHALVAFARRRVETCKGPAGSAALTFGYAELGLAAGERIVIANPISPSA